MSDYEEDSSLEEDSDQQPTIRQKKRKKKPIVISNSQIPSPNARITINLALTHYDVIEQVAYELGWKIQHNMKYGSVWDVLWTDHHIQPDMLFRLQLYQKVSHFPGIHVLSRKNLLGLSFMDMYKRAPDYYNFFPKTWLLPSQYGELRKQLIAEDKTFIVKPQADCQGRGIFLTQKIEEVQNGEHYVVQQYISRPFLVDGLKFDFRVYVLFCGVSPLRLYIYEQGLARFATEPYVAPNKQNLKKQYMHLTNYAINKKNPKFVYNSSSQRMDVGHKRALTSVLKVIQKKGYNIEQMKSQINDAIIKTLILGHPLVAHQYRFCQPNDEQRNMCFHILGIDIMLDAECKPYILQVNHTPSFVTDTPLDHFIKFSLIKDTLLLMNINPQSRAQAVQKINKLQKEKNMLRQKRQLYENLEKQQKVKAAQQERTKYEGENLGKYTRIFPLEDQQKMAIYEQLLQIAEKAYFSDNNILRTQMQKQKIAEQANCKQKNRQKDKEKQKQEPIRKTIYEQIISSISPPKMKKIISMAQKYTNQTQKINESPSSLVKRERVGSYAQSRQKKSIAMQVRQMQQQLISPNIKNQMKQHIKQSASIKIKIVHEKNVLPKITQAESQILSPIKKEQNQYVDYRKKKIHMMKVRQQQINGNEIKGTKQLSIGGRSKIVRRQKRQSDSEEDDN